ncbi:MAG: hypothetical protein QXJ75_02710 [Candidatus Bathyarchaeia archaeon]
MLTRICSVDLKSGILCQRCEEKVRSGEITKLDLEVAKVLLELEARYPALQSVYLHKAVEAGNILAIIVNKSDIPRLRECGGRLRKEISERIGRQKILIMAPNEENRQFLENLFAPASILTVNTIWVPDGSIETKVVIPKRDLPKIPAKIEDLKELAKKVQNLTLRVEFESASG